MSELRVMRPEEIAPANVVQCEGQSLCNWLVADSPAEGVAYHSETQYRRDTLPGAVEARHGDRPWCSVGSDRRRIVVPVADGWIVAHAYTSPQSQGGLWWVGKDGSRERQLGKQEVAELVVTKVGIVAATKGGDVRLIQRTRERGWSTRLIASLSAATWTATRAADGSVYAVTSTQLVRVALNGKTTVLHTGRWDRGFQVASHSGALLWAPFAPGSIIVRRAGDIFIGMNGVVVRLVPRRGGYDEEWLMPPTCVGAVGSGRPTTK